jgi:C4-dicarboxylate-specific signal transduction histidine kinase
LGEFGEWSDPALQLGQLMEIARASALAEMASGVAHELNQPLGAIATFAQAGERMLDRADPMVGRALDVFREINRAALGAGQGILRIRNLFEQEQPKRSRCKFSEVIEQLRPFIEVLATGAKCGVQIEIAEILPDLMIDRLRIQHVLYALTQNALDASADSPGVPSVRIDISADRYSVETAVTDSGSGVPAELQSQLFRPFFTTKAKGTGLGLASSRAIIESHEGSIGFDNLSAGGCRFWFRLPCADKLPE